MLLPTCGGFKMTETNTKKFPARVVKIIDAYTIVINRGGLDGVKLNQPFLMYCLSGEEIIDPETYESLGHLEIIRGRGTVSHVQDRISTIKSIMTATPTRRIIRRKPGSMFGFMDQGEQEEISEGGELLPFNDVRVGDKAKPI